MSTAEIPSFYAEVIPHLLDLIRYKNAEIARLQAGFTPTAEEGIKPYASVQLKDWFRVTNDSVVDSRKIQEAYLDNARGPKYRRKVMKPRKAARSKKATR